MNIDSNGEERYLYENKGVSLSSGQGGAQILQSHSQQWSLHPVSALDALREGRRDINTKLSAFQQALDITSAQHENLL